MRFDAERRSIEPGRRGATIVIGTPLTIIVGWGTWAAREVTLPSVTQHDDGRFASARSSPGPRAAERGWMARRGVAAGDEEFAALMVWPPNAWVRGGRSMRRDPRERSGRSDRETSRAEPARSCPTVCSEPGLGPGARLTRRLGQEPEAAERQLVEQREKMADVAPIPRASVRGAITVNAGLRRAVETRVARCARDRRATVRRAGLAALP